MSNIEKSNEFSVDKNEYQIIDERRLWVHKDINLNEIYSKSNSIYIFTKPSDYTQKSIIKIGETGSINDRSVKDRIYEQPNSTDTEPLLLLFVIDCKSYIDRGIIKNAKELESYLHKYFSEKQTDVLYDVKLTKRKGFNINIPKVTLKIGKNKGFKGSRSLDCEFFGGKGSSKGKWWDDPKLGYK